MSYTAQNIHRKSAQKKKKKTVTSQNKYKQNIVALNRSPPVSTFAWCIKYGFSTGTFSFIISKSQALEPKELNNTQRKMHTNIVLEKYVSYEHDMSISVVLA